MVSLLSDSAKGATYPDPATSHLPAVHLRRDRGSDSHSTGTYSGTRGRSRSSKFPQSRGKLRIGSEPLIKLRRSMCSTSSNSMEVKKKIIGMTVQRKEPIIQEKANQVIKQICTQQQGVSSHTAKFAPFKRTETAEACCGLNSLSEWRRSLSSSNESWNRSTTCECHQRQKQILKVPKIAWQIANRQ